MTQLDIEAGNDEEYKVEGIRDSTVFAKESEARHLPEICLPGAESTWEPASAVWPFRKLVSAFILTSRLRLLLTVVPTHDGSTSDGLATTQNESAADYLRWS